MGGAMTWWRSLARLGACSTVAAFFLPWCSQPAADQAVSAKYSAAVLAALSPNPLLALWLIVLAGLLAFAVTFARPPRRAARWTVAGGVACLASAIGGWALINVVNVLLAIPNPPQPIHWEIGLWLSLLASTSVLVSGIGMVRSEHGSL